MKQPVCAPGTVIGEKYRIDKAIARGGCSIVYQGTHLGMKRPVALKLMYTEVEGISEAWTMRFEREAQLVSQLEHQNTITLFDYGFDRGFWYIAMEWVEGASLRNVIRDGGEMDAKRCARLTLMILDSLVEAHKKKILHRDMKPSNIMISTNLEGEEIVKVLDFGLAKIDLENLEGEALKLTMDGEFVGTPRYAAPEQLKFKELTPATDIYGVGMVMWEMLMGKPAVPKVDYATCVQHHLGPDPWRLPPGFVPAELASIVECALEKEPEGRYSSCVKMRNAIDHWLQGEEAPAKSDSSSSQTWSLEGDSDGDDSLSKLFDETSESSLLPPVELVGGGVDVEPKSSSFEDELLAELEQTPAVEAGSSQEPVENFPQATTPLPKRPITGKSIKVGGSVGGTISPDGHLMRDKSNRSNWFWVVAIVGFVGVTAGGFFWYNHQIQSQQEVRRGMTQKKNDALLAQLRAKQDKIMSAQGVVPAPWEVSKKENPQLRALLVKLADEGWARKGQPILTNRSGVSRAQVKVAKKRVVVELTLYQCDTEQQARDVVSHQASDVKAMRLGQVVVRLRPMGGKLPPSLVKRVESELEVLSP